MLFKLFVLCTGDQNIGQNAQQQSASDGSQRDFAEGNGQAAHTGDQDHGNHKQVLALTQIYLLYHLQAADSDEAVQSGANAAHDAVGDGSQESNEGGPKKEITMHMMAAVVMVMTEAFRVMATQPTDSP